MQTRIVSNIICLTGACLFLTGMGTGVRAASVKVDDLRCEYLKNPLGLDVCQPRFSWKLVPTSKTARGQRQTAYQIQVADSKESLSKATLWDSSVIKSDQSVNVAYEGKTLESGHQYFWKARVQDENGKWTSWSQPATWTMGLLDKNEWKAQWIGSGKSFVPDKGSPVNNTTPDPWFRKTFDLSGKVTHAPIYVASVGYHELYVNGKKVGDSILAPSATDYKVRARYVTYEIAPYLKPGRNVIALWLGSGWSIYVNYQTADKPRAPIVMAHADIELADGSKVQVVTDETWKTHDSPNTVLGEWQFTNYGGELYDANKELPGWNEVSLDDSSWKSAVVHHPNLILSADKTEPNRLETELKAIAIETTTNGAYRVDMGSNYSGWFEIQLSGNPGDRINFQFSERPNRDMTHNMHSSYIIGPSGKGTFRNHFNYGCGRWVKITGLREKPQLNQIRGWLVRTDYQRTGGFECDQPLLNRIYNTTLWTYECLSLGSYVVDCPQRERMGYGGDAHATTRTALNNYSLGAFYTKWIQDWRDVQDTNGNLPYTAPTYWGGGGPGWSGYCITLPWEIYRRYGDIRILKENFAMMQKWLAFVETKTAKDMLVRYGGEWDFLGDWLWPGAQGVNGDTKETLFYNNCYWIYNLRTATRVAEIIGNKEAAEAYRSRANTVAKAVHTTFYNPADSSYVNGFPAYLAIALLVDVPPQDVRPAVWHRLEKEILEIRKGHIHAGITGGAFLFKTLIENNRNDLVYPMVTKEDYPGWGQMLNDGATTFYEDWEHVESCLHSSYLYVGSWFNECLGGIQHPDAGGFKSFVIHPWIDPQQGPRHVRSHYDSLYGRAATEWSVNGNAVQLSVTVPPNTEATLQLDKVKSSTLTENGQSLDKSKGITILSGEKATQLRLEPGHYEFKGSF